MSQPARSIRDVLERPLAATVGFYQRFIKPLLSGLLVGGVHGYQWLFRPLLGKRCRFYPSCSDYFIGAVQKYGPMSGALRGVWRILRCHPFHPGGYDPP